MEYSNTTDRVTSLCAIVAAIAAVMVAAYEARINREYQRISVWPRLQQSNSFVPSEPYLRTVSNVGVGPALLRSVQVSVDGVLCRTWAEVIQAMIGRPVSGHIYSSLNAGAVLLPDKPVNALQLAPGEDARKFWKEAQGKRLSIRICYSSLYDEHWLSDSFEAYPKPVTDCRSNPAKEFQQ
jgi:hypothetical protein